MVSAHLVTLCPKEFAMLCLLVNYPGRVFTKEQIYEVVYGDILPDMLIITKERKFIGKGREPGEKRIDLLGTRQFLLGLFSVCLLRLCQTTILYFCWELVFGLSLCVFIH